MFFAFTDDLIVTNGFDGEMAMLADRHYSRQKIGTRQFLPNGRKLVIRDAFGDVLFGWMFQEHRDDGQQGVNCSIFRNESRRKSSDIILECEELAVRKWGPQRMFTYINPAKIRSVNPGYCFKHAGWTNVRDKAGAPFVSRKGLYLLEKF